MRSLLLARSLRRPLHTSSRLLAAPKAAASRIKPSTDEYGTPHRRALPPLGRDGAVEDRFNKVSSKEPLRRKTKAKAAPKPKKDDDAEGEGELPLGGEAEAEAEVTSMLEMSIRRDLARYPDAILLTQVGSFFESYFDQAPLVARLLSIKLTSKNFGRGANRARKAFAGFPLSQLSKHASTLVEAGHKVVVVEEFKEPSGETRREVTRIVSPGTGIDEGFVKGEEMAFVLAVGVEESGKVVLAYRDISTGASFTRSSSIEGLRDDMLLVSPKEVVVEEGLARSEMGKRVMEVIKGEVEREGIMLSTTDLAASPAPSSATVDSSAERILLSYLASNLPSAPPPRIKPHEIDPTTIMQMDAVTLKSLEIRESLRGGTKGSLLSTVKRTVTPGGARLLAERLCAPSTLLPEINSRLALVSAFHHLPSTRRYLLALLKTLDDSPRLLQRLYLRRGSAFDLLGLKRTIEAAGQVKQVLRLCEEEEAAPGETEAIAELRGRLEWSGQQELAEMIGRAVDEEALVERTLREEKRAELLETLGTAAVEKEEEIVGGAASKMTEGLWGKNEPWAVRPEFSPSLRSLHSELTSLRTRADELEKALQVKYSLKTLALRVVPKTGSVVHVTGKGAIFTRIDADQGITQVVKNQSTRSYVLGEWSSLSLKISKLITRITNLEAETIKALVDRVLERYDSLQETAQVLSELDVSLGFAELATELDLVKPTVDDRTSLNIVAGRHPTVEHALRLQGRAFTPNNVHFSHPSSFVHVLTGPNMAGKSTFLRQTAIITILAQAGSFVPADSVGMGVVDRVFSRVGARDELDRDRSTFMIEMDEATSILNTATERSLVLLDELGRGTSPLDGLAIAYAALEHLVHVNRSRTLFATHYHRLGELLGYEEDNPRGKAEWEGVEFWCTDVEEGEDTVTYLHDVRRGLNDDSAGLIIARLSGMPARAVEVATELRNRYR